MQAAHYACWFSVSVLVFPRMSLKPWALATSLCLALAAGTTGAQTAPTSSAPPKVFHYAFNVAETGLDPAQLSDLYSRIITSNIFDALYTYDFLARPVKVRPNLAEDMPVT